MREATRQAAIRKNHAEQLLQMQVRETGRPLQAPAPEAGTARAPSPARAGAPMPQGGVAVSTFVAPSVASWTAASHPVPPLPISPLPVDQAAVLAQTATLSARSNSPARTPSPALHRPAVVTTVQLPREPMSTRSMSVGQLPIAQAREVAALRPVVENSPRGRAQMVETRPYHFGVAPDGDARVRSSSAIGPPGRTASARPPLPGRVAKPGDSSNRVRSSWDLIGRGSQQAESRSQPTEVTVVVASAKNAQPGSEATLAAMTIAEGTRAPHVRQRAPEEPPVQPRHAAGAAADQDVGNVTPRGMQQSGRRETTPPERRERSHANTTAHRPSRGSVSARGPTTVATGPSARRKTMEAPGLASGHSHAGRPSGQHNTTRQPRNSIEARSPGARSGSLPRPQPQQRAPAARSPGHGAPATARVPQLGLPAQAEAARRAGAGPAAPEKRQGGPGAARGMDLYNEIAQSQSSARSGAPTQRSARSSAPSTLDSARRSYPRPAGNTAPAAQRHGSSRPRGDGSAERTPAARAQGVEKAASGPCLGGPLPRGARQPGSGMDRTPPQAWRTIGGGGARVAKPVRLGGGGGPRTSNAAAKEGDGKESSAMSNLTASRECLSHTPPYSVGNSVRSLGASTDLTDLPACRLSAVDYISECISGELTGSVRSQSTTIAEAPTERDGRRGSSPGSAAEAQRDPSERDRLVRVAEAETETREARRRVEAGLEEEQRQEQRELRRRIDMEMDQKLQELHKSRAASQAMRSCSPAVWSDSTPSPSSSRERRRDPADGAADPLLRSAPAGLGAAEEVPDRLGGSAGAVRPLGGVAEEASRRPRRCGGPPTPVRERGRETPGTPTSAAPVPRAGPYSPQLRTRGLPASPPRSPGSPGHRQRAQQTPKPPPASPGRPQPRDILNRPVSRCLQEDARPFATTAPASGQAASRSGRSPAEKRRGRMLGPGNVATSLSGRGNTARRVGGC